MLYLLTLATQFITERNWWQFRNSKNDTMNIIVEIGELAEHFISNDISTKRDKIAEELADVLFASFCFILPNKIDISHTMGSMTDGSELKDTDSSYEQLQELVLKNLAKFNLSDLTIPSQVALSLTWHASQLGDIFVWSTQEQSEIRANDNHSLIATYIAHIIAHLIYLSTLIDSNLPRAYIDKMQKNASKYPMNKSSGQDYFAIKDQSRGRTT